METIEKTCDLDSVFADVQSSLQDMSFARELDLFQSDLASAEAEAFKNETEPGGTKWEQLKPSTIARKGHSRILFETGALETSLITIGAENNISAVSERGSIFGTSDPKALFHQLGTDRMPARPPVGISSELVDKLAGKIADDAVRQLTRGK